MGNCLQLDGTSFTVAYQQLRYGTSQNLCQLEGYVVYTLEHDIHYIMTGDKLLGEDGKVYWLENADGAEGDGRGWKRRDTAVWLAEKTVPLT